MTAATLASGLGERLIGPRHLTCRARCCCGSSCARCFLQASLEPAGDAEPRAGLRALPGAGAALPGARGAEAAVQRHLAFFNTHPYVAAAIVGGVLYHEERIAPRRGGRPERVTAFKARPDGPAGGAGRRLLLALAQAGRGRALRGAGALCWAPGPRCSSWSSTTSVHLTLRARLFWLGLTAGGPAGGGGGPGQPARPGGAAAGGGGGERGGAGGLAGRRLRGATGRAWAVRSSRRWLSRPGGGRATCSWPAGARLRRAVPLAALLAGCVGALL